MRKLFLLFVLTSSINLIAQNANTDRRFEEFKVRFLDACWKQYPALSIQFGYGKYYDKSSIPDEQRIRSNVAFSKRWMDSLHSFSFKQLSDNNKSSYKIIDHRLKLIIWEIETFKNYQWDPSLYNIARQCNALYTQAYAPLDEKLRTLSSFLKYAGDYYRAAIQIIQRPTKEHTQLAITQNEGALSVFGKPLEDSIAASNLSATEKDTLRQRIQSATTAIKDYISALKSLVDNKSYSFRSFRIGEDLFNQKFQREMVTDYTAKQIFQKAITAKKNYHREMYPLADHLWKKYCGSIEKPKDSLLLIKSVIDKISLNQVAPANLFDTLNRQLSKMKQFVVQKNLFDFDTTAPIVIRKMPAFTSGVALASAFIPSPYQKVSVAYYNMIDITAMPSEKAENMLREYNDYMIQILTIHEGVPGHCMQGIYSSRKSPDIIKSVFRNAVMSEGWAVYSERMMLENGWGNNSPEMWLMYYKWSLRIACNVIIDYGIHCLNYNRDDVIRLLRDEAFQEEVESGDKYQRATLSQVQLCTYFTGATEIQALRDEYKKRMGKNFKLKDFHERFLSYGTAPVKFIRELMLLKAL